MAEHSWARLLPWRHRDKAKSKSPQIKFTPRLRITREDGWRYLELQLMNHSAWPVWVEDTSVVLVNLKANLQTTAAPGQAKHKILQYVSPNDTLSVSLAGAIYDAAGRPQGLYACLVCTDVHYRVADEWCSVKIATYRVEMDALGVYDLRSAGSYDKRIIQSNGSLGLTRREYKE